MGPASSKGRLRIAGSAITGGGGARIAGTARRACAALLLVASLAAGAQAQSEAQSPYRVAASPPKGFDREAAQRDTRRHLESLIRRDTRNPPGNERLTATYFDSIFNGIEGVERHVLDVGENRANFVARLRAGKPRGRPVLLMGHMDVVGTDSTKWETPPLEPSEREGYLYGRGAIDDKGMLAAAATAFQQLARRRASLTRDVIFLGTAAEEGGDDVGIDSVVANHKALIGDAEFALNEGGRVRVEGGRVRSVNVQVTEKLSHNVKATARAEGGHGSVPLPGNALAALARAIARVHEWRAPVRLSETTRLYFAGLAKIEADPEMRRAMEEVSTATDSAAIERAAAVLSREPLHNAVLRTAQSLTMLDGGFRVNVIPSEGTANFNVRIFPGDDITQVVAAMNRVGGEPSVTFALDGAPREPPPASPVDSELYRAMEDAAGAMAPDAVVIPFMSTGGTDGAVLRANGIPTYGILPMPLPVEDELRMHGDNERVPVAALGWAAEYIYRVLLQVAG